MEIFEREIGIKDVAVIGAVIVLVVIAMLMMSAPHAPRTQSSIITPKDKPLTNLSTSANDSPLGNFSIKNRTVACTTIPKDNLTWNANHSVFYGSNGMCIVYAEGK